MLDNFESVSGDGALDVVRLLLERIPELRLLITSRSSLGLPSQEEKAHELKVLELEEAVELFRRAAPVKVAEDELGEVEAICELLDRIPLAVEQAAMWTEAVPLKALREGLEESALSLTPVEEKAYPERQRGLAVSFRYTFDHLSDDGKRMWCVFAVFKGAPTYEALKAVAAFEGREKGLAELTRWRLTRREDDRYPMLPTVRAYVEVALRESGPALGLDEKELKTRHATFYIQLADKAFINENFQAGKWADVEEEDGADIFAAADWATARLAEAEGMVVDELPGDWEALEPLERENEKARWMFALASALALYSYVFWRRPKTGRAWLAAGLVSAQRLGKRKRVSLLCNQLGLWHGAQGDYGRALEYYGKSAKICEELGDRAGLTTTYNNIAGIYYAQGDYGQALEYYRKALAIQEEIGDRAGLATTYNNIGEVYRTQGDYERALEYHRKALVIREEVGDRAGLAVTYNNIGLVYRAQGDYEQALRYYEKALKLFEILGMRLEMAVTYHNMGLVALAQGDRERTSEWFRQSRDLYRELRLEHEVVEEEKMMERVSGS